MQNDDLSTMDRLFVLRYQKENYNIWSGLEKKIEFQLVLWVSSCNILLAAWGKFFLVLVNDQDDLLWTLAIGQLSFKSYLPSKKIYLFCPAGLLDGTFSSPVDSNETMSLPVVLNSFLWVTVQ